jgi:hypothetical protein
MKLYKFWIDGDSPNTDRYTFARSADDLIVRLRVKANGKDFGFHLAPSK